MTIAYVLALCLMAVLLGYQLRFTEATRHIGRSLSGAASGAGLQDAITPPITSYLAFLVYGLVVLVIALGFLTYGFLVGFATLVGFYLLVAVIRLCLLPKPESAHFTRIVIGSMVRRHANYLRDGDHLRAGAMADLLKRAGVPVDDFVERTRRPENGYYNELTN